MPRDRQTHSETLALVCYLAVLFLLSPYLPEVVRWFLRTFPSTGKLALLRGEGLVFCVGLVVLMWRGWSHNCQRVAVGVGAGLGLVAVSIFLLLPNVFEHSHIFLYLVLGWLFLRWFRKRQESHNDGVARLYGYTLLACASVGLVDEIYQAILPNRTFNWYDVVLNAVGGSLAVIWSWLGEGDSSERISGRDKR